MTKAADFTSSSFIFSFTQFFLQGWNSTWDRYVTDEFILKDTEENRKLQKELAEEAQLTPGGNLYKKDRKKRIRVEPKAVIEPVRNSEEEAALVDEINKEDEIQVPSDSILLPKRKLPDLEFPENLKYHTGYNCHLAHEKNMLIQLPCQPNVVTLLEDYLKYLARNYFSDNKTKKKNRQQEVLTKQQIEKRYQICIEVLDGLRICFNTFLFKQLLVNEDEQAQYYEALKMNIQAPVKNNNLSETNGERTECDHTSNGGIENHVQENKNHLRARRENTRSSTSQYASSQKTCSDCSLTKSQCSKIVQDMFEKVRDEYVSKAESWKAVPDSAYDEDIKQPAIVYGAYHLLRLLENLPKILAYTEVDGEKLSTVYSYTNGLLNYLSSQTHLYGMQYYVKNEIIEPVKPSTHVRSHRKS
ncbi:male-specific lethal 3 homolog isoform X2 [Adelges cooleyi]|uniref:male-specific lethal 3 homolog isoform X2 n=1 Tax=Adelges cooleyi TaxID=133065 RepID=UPI00217FE8AE|nr:male-specific lethal 3 homolog isoform X2 [Adelges cooleyi]